MHKSNYHIGCTFSNISTFSDLIINGIARFPPARREPGPPDRDGMFNLLCALDRGKRPSTARDDVIRATLPAGALARGQVH